MTDNSAANILHLQRLSTEDGPGIRTTIFFKGCPLNCPWCHNPESIKQKPQLQWHASRCMGCKSCLTVCPMQALSQDETRSIKIKREACDGCGLCTEVCPTTALELLGIKWNLEDLVQELIKDLHYFTHSQGGVTASGGEPTLQAGFVFKLFKRLKSYGIDTALDTCGFCSRDNLGKLLPFTDLILYDIKCIDDVQHLLWTGKSNHIILENLTWLINQINLEGLTTRVWIRTPLIPGTTANPENLRQIGNYLSTLPGSVINRWELCAFNNLCQAKYERLDETWAFGGTPLLLRDDLDSLLNTARESGTQLKNIFVTGAARLVENYQ